MGDGTSFAPQVEVSPQPVALTFGHGREFTYNVAIGADVLPELNDANKALQRNGGSLTFGPGEFLVNGYGLCHQVRHRSITAQWSDA